MKSISLTSSALFAVVVLAAACGGSPTPPSATPPVPSAAEPSTPAPAAEAAAWSDSLPIEKQVEFMKTHVMPKMSKVFQGHNADRYAQFTCATCHGPNKQNPKQFLPKLAMKDGKLTAFAEKPEVSKWMAEAVVPEMAAAMGLPPYDPQTHKGFGCGGCHGIQN